MRGYREQIKQTANGVTKIVTVETKSEPYRKGSPYIEATMHTTDYTHYVDKVAKNTLCIRILNHFVLRLTRHSPFITLSQKDLAIALGSYESNISVALKKLLVDNVIIRLESDLFAFNPRYVWKCNFDKRSFWIQFTDAVGYAEAYKIYSSGKAFDEAKDKYHYPN